MPSKQDRRRKKRLRHEQSATTRFRKELRRAAEEAVEQTRRAVDVLVATAGREEEPVAVLGGLRELFDSAAGRLLLEAPAAVTELGERLGQQAGDERGRALAAALRAAGDDRLAWVTVGVLAGAGDVDGADGLAAELVAAEDDPERRSEVALLLASIRLELGRPADALHLLEGECARDPEDDELQAFRARLLARTANLAGRRGDEARRTEETSHTALPSPEQLAAALPALDRFADRSGLVELQQAVTAFVAADDRLASAVAASAEATLAEAREGAGLGPLDQLGEGITVRVATDPADPMGAVGATLDALRAMATERAWLAGADEDEDEDGEEGPSVLERFAADPATPPALAGAARAWDRHVRYGLWQPQPGAPVTAPAARRAAAGTWATDLVTRRTAYLAIPDEQLDGLPRWSVLVGPVGPVGGVWHTGPAMVVLDPQAADQATEALLDVRVELLAALAREAGLRPPLPPRRDRPQAEPHGVLAELTEAMDGAEADITAKVIGASLGNLLGFVRQSSVRAPTMTNTDGDPVELLEATFPAEDPAAVRRRLLLDPDFEGDGDEGAAEGEAATLRWLGRFMTPEEAANSVAQAQAELRRQGLGPLPLPDGPRRWLRGLVRFEPGAVRVEVNSRGRLAAVTRKLRAAGAGEPVVGVAVDPTLDLPLPGVPAAGGRAPGDPEAEAVWRSHWLDTRVPALGGATPRAAAEDPRRRVRLEALLRQFEHDADLAAAAGERPLDVERLRETLGMADGV